MGHATTDVHTFSLVTRDKPGVLVRIALVFARRGFNIESLAVSPGAVGGFARMTITSRGNPEALEQIIKQLAKLIDVVYVTGHQDDKPLEIEVALIKLRCDRARRDKILEILPDHHAAVMHSEADDLVLRATGSSDDLDVFLALLEEYGLEEVVRSGRIVIDPGLSQFSHLLRPRA